MDEAIIIFLVLAAMLLACRRPEGFERKTHIAGYLGLSDAISDPRITAKYPFLPESKPHKLPNPARFLYNRSEALPPNYIFNNLHELDEKYPRYDMRYDGRSGQFVNLPVNQIAKQLANAPVVPPVILERI